MTKKNKMTKQLYRYEKVREFFRKVKDFIYRETTENTPAEPLNENLNAAAEITKSPQTKILTSDRQERISVREFIERELD